MTNVILALNVGSTSIKFSLFTEPTDGPPVSMFLRGMISGIGDEARLVVHGADGQCDVDERIHGSAGRPVDHESALHRLLAWIDGRAAGWTITAAGHRVVHGGTEFAAPVLVDWDVMRRLESLVPLAPLHQAHNLAGIRALAAHRPSLPQVACFDTAFHCSQPAVAQAFALPPEVTDLGVKRYGFHGLSYEYIARVLPTYMGAAADGRVLVAHLGGGASLCAMRGRRSVATTMSFTALDGLPMGTRCGAIDPGVILYLLGERHMDLATVTDLLYHRSGLLGVSGISGEVHKLLACHSARAAEAVDLFVYHIVRELGSLTAALGGLDGLVFTAGIGEHAALIRARVAQAFGWLGMRLDESANRADGPRIHAADSAVSIWVIPTDEDRMIVEHTLEVLHRGPNSANVQARPLAEFE